VLSWSGVNDVGEEEGSGGGEIRDGAMGGDGDGLLEVQSLTLTSQVGVSHHRIAGKPPLKLELTGLSPSAAA
jgi:hypothetical protein